MPTAGAHDPRLRQHLERALPLVGEEREQHVDPVDLQRHWQQTDDRLTENYLEVWRVHAEFHELARRIVELAAAGQVADAYTLLYGEYITLSGRLVLAMRAWQENLLGIRRPTQ